ncbi:L-seryl-tRNA(Sec) selenium transferase [Sedimentibacter sp. zth1]|uniref:L-seryl-tRNA(Sec) selenium transferase n=1 Tax=Sedimentibacter sp. zth1 TaxID=2816908 RepID=UPI001A914A99|nr:L-seryl-tRNA(Sec) selenium transferase [Sedimentibacter sp. zth1]QSX06964.1 L-seryl-tRNA(Sec) selenium transferase [Sedimentibacter sp. zth1]
MNKNAYFRNIPKVDILIEDERIKNIIKKNDRDLVIEIIRERTDELRKFITNSDSEQAIEERIANLIVDIVKSVNKITELNMKKVINGTGTILHTNLGRAIISEKIADRIKEIVTGYSNLEYDIEKGERGERYSHFEDIVCRITGAEACMAVNNNAAAVMLILSTMAKGNEVIVSRGELVEIGGSFRVPDVMIQSGSKLVEIGTTNKTHLSDYENAITEETKAFLKVHTSNYRIVGFTESVGIKELSELSKKHSLPVIEDIGSGVLIDLSKYGLAYEPTVQESIRNGADVVCFSGDKLLGGPQAGIIVGRKDLINKMKKNPLTRAMRIDKFTATALEAVFHEYLDEESAIKNIPVLSMITRDIKEIEKQAESLMTKLSGCKEKATIEIEDCLSQIGGGSLPLERIKSKCISIKPNSITTQIFENRLRNSQIPVIIRIANDKAIIDMRTIATNEIEILSQTIKNAFI